MFYQQSIFPINASPITDPTANWKTYTNNEFLFKYPPYWSDPIRNDLSTRYDLDFNTTLFITSGIFYSQDEQRELTLKEYLTKFNRVAEDTFLDKLSGKRFSYQTVDSKQEIDVVVAESLSSFHIFVITFKYDSDDMDALKKFDQILSTFKFLDSAEQSYVCPQSEWVDCMPGPGIRKAECEPEYLQWAQANCPDFKGVAY